MEVRKISNTKNIICLVIGCGMLFICVISILVGIFFEKRKWLSQSSDLFFFVARCNRYFININRHCEYCKQY